MSYMGKLNLEALLVGPIAKHVYECFMAEVGELGALLAYSLTYNKGMKVRYAEQWRSVIRTEIDV